MAAGMRLGWTCCARFIPASIRSRPPAWRWTGVRRGPAAHQLPQRLLGLRADRPAQGAAPRRIQLRRAVSRRRRWPSRSATSRSRPRPHRVAPPRAAPRAPRSRSAWPRTSRRSELFRAPGRVDPRADATDWICVVSDDCSDPSASPRCERGAGGRPALRAVALAAAARLLPQLRARAGARPAPRPRYVALADQDDVWHPDKLETLLREIGDAQLVYSDARIVDGDGARDRRHVLEPARATTTPTCCRCWSRTAVTGAASLFPARRCWTTRSRSPRRSSRTSTTTGSALMRAGARRHRLRRPAALRLRAARRRDARARGREPDAGAARPASRRSGATRASGCGCGACTTSSTPAA